MIYFVYKINKNCKQYIIYIILFPSLEIQLIGYFLATSSRFRFKRSKSEWLVW
jgi:hypothetical protein